MKRAVSGLERLYKKGLLDEEPKRIDMLQKLQHACQTFQLEQDIYWRLWFVANVSTKITLIRIQRYSQSHDGYARQILPFPTQSHHSYALEAIPYIISGFEQFLSHLLSKASFLTGLDGNRPYDFQTFQGLTPRFQTLYHQAKPILATTTPDPLHYPSFLAGKVWHTLNYEDAIYTINQLEQIALSYPRYPHLRRNFLQQLAQIHYQLTGKLIQIST